MTAQERCAFRGDACQKPRRHHVHTKPHRPGDMDRAECRDLHHAFVPPKPAPSVPGPQSAAQIGPPALTAEEWRNVKTIVSGRHANADVEALARFALEARKTLLEIEEWRRSQEVQGAFLRAVQDGYTVSKGFAGRADEMFECARALAANRKEQEGT